METIEFKDIYDLYERVQPALRSKVKELKQEKKLYIKEKDIFEYLSENVWYKSNDLSLDEIVDDILMLDNEKIDKYVQEKIIRQKFKKEEK